MEVLNEQDSEAVVNAAISAGIDVDEGGLRRDYSGRFMFGQRCFGIVGSDSQWAEFVIALKEDEAQGLASKGLAKKLADYLDTDSMGLSTIYYFPGFLLDGDDEEGEDE
jgi:NADH/NAD ratio-sensing transcriptional regulator Rex